MASTQEFAGRLTKWDGIKWINEKHYRPVQWNLQTGSDSNMVHGPIGGIIYNEGNDDGVWALFPSTPLEEWDTTTELNKF